MSFLKPSSATGTIGYYSFGSIIPSWAQSYIDNQFPNCLDKTGDIITGNISVAAGGTLTVNTGSTFTLQDGSYMYVGMAAIEMQGILTVDALVNPTAAINISNGGYITVDSSSTVSIYGYLDLQNGSNSYLDGTLTIDTSGVVQANSGSAITINNGAVLTVHNDTASNFQVANSPQYITPQSTYLVGDFCAVADGYNANWNYHFPAVGAIRDNNQSLPGTQLSWLVPINLNHYNGATFDSLTFYYILSSTPRPSPDNPISIQVLRRAVGGVGQVALNSSDPQVLPIGNWSNSGIQSFVYTANQNQQIFTSSYTYWLLITSEYGTNAMIGDEFLNFAVKITNITAVGTI